MSGVRANCRAMWSRENRAGNKSTEWGREGERGRERGGGWEGGRQIERQGNGAKVKRKARDKREKKVK